MRYDLKVPCKNCPFRSDETRIEFVSAKRAEEIAEQAYRNGFPCHKSAEFVEDYEGSGGYHAAENSQHCAGALMMFIQDGQESWPGVGNDEELVEKLAQRLNFDNVPVFQSEQEFIDANDPEFQQQLRHKIIMDRLRKIVTAHMKRRRKNGK